MNKLKILDDDALERLEQMCEAATPEPWQSVHACAFLSKNINLHQTGYAKLKGPKQVPAGHVGTFWNADADFCAAARTALPELIAEVRRLREIEKRAGTYLDNSKLERIERPDMVIEEEHKC